MLTQKEILALALAKTKVKTTDPNTAENGVLCVPLGRAMLKSYDGVGRLFLAHVSSAIKAADGTVWVTLACQY